LLPISWRSAWPNSEFASECSLRVDFIGWQRGGSCALSQGENKNDGFDKIVVALY
jgi:hypothetical protein